MFSFLRKKKQLTEFVVPEKEKAANIESESENRAPIPSTNWQPNGQYEHISSVLEGLFKRISEVLDVEFQAYKPKADVFFSSPQSRDAGATEVFRNENKSKRDETVMQVVQSYIHLIGDEAVEAYNRAIDFFKPQATPSADYSYGYVSWGYITYSNLTEEERKTIDKERRRSLAASIIRWYEADREAILKYWKPIHVISGKYGQYNDCVCYDEEFNVFLSLTPDDNYYHWGSYLMHIIDKETAEKLTGESLTVAKDANVSPYFKKYFPFDSIEVAVRIDKE